MDEKLKLFEDEEVNCESPPYRVLERKDTKKVVWSNQTYPNITEMDADQLAILNEKKPSELDHKYSEADFDNKFKKIVMKLNVFSLDNEASCTQVEEHNVVDFIENEDENAKQQDGKPCLLELSKNEAPNLYKNVHCITEEEEEEEVERNNHMALKIKMFENFQLHEKIKELEKELYMTKKSLEESNNENYKFKMLQQKFDCQVQALFIGGDRVKNVYQCKHHALDLGKKNVEDELKICKMKLKEVEGFLQHFNNHKELNLVLGRDLDILREQLKVLKSELRHKSNSNEILCKEIKKLNRRYQLAMNNASDNLSLAEKENKLKIEAERANQKLLEDELEKKNKEVQSVTKQFDAVVQASDTQIRAYQNQIKSLNDQLSSAQNDISAFELMKTSAFHTIATNKEKLKIESEKNVEMSKCLEFREDQCKQLMDNLKLIELQKDKLEIETEFLKLKLEMQSNSTNTTS